VTGKFKDVAGQIVLNEEDLARCSVEITIQAASVDTGIDDRDAHLRQAEFFDAATHPLITFRSTRIDKTAEGYRASGTLTLRGVAKEVVVPFRKTALEWKDGRPLLGVAGELKLARSEYGVGTGWRHSVIENFLGDEVGVEFFLWTKLGRPVEEPQP
jgi:polyisoprenoid-binding protein YceI